jgi:electron transport complex protein RnfD
MGKKEVHIEQKPQVNISRPTAGRMWLIGACAVPGIVQSGLTDSGASLIVAASALASAVLVELLLTWKASGFEKIKDGSAAASALVFSLLLPNHIHPVCAGLGAAFAMAVVKHSFGGLGSNWMNPGLGGWLFVRFSWPGFFDRALEGSPLAVFHEGLRAGVFGISGMDQFSAAASPLDGAVRGFFNSRIFSAAGAELPPGYIDLLVSRSPGIIADRGLLALLAGTIVIAAFQARRAWIPAVFLGVFGVLVRAFGALPYGGLPGQGDVLFAFFSGGTFAAAFLLAADPATGAKSNAGVLAAVILAGILAWFFRCRGLEPYGAFFAVALVNALSPLIRSLERRLFYASPGRFFV